MAMPGSKTEVGEQVQEHGVFRKLLTHPWPTTAIAIVSKGIA
jgi:hypothetical protein